jgi:hypothetical protein
VPTCGTLPSAANRARALLCATDRLAPEARSIPNRRRGARLMRGPRAGGSNHHPAFLSLGVVSLVHKVRAQAPLPSPVSCLRDHCRARERGISAANPHQTTDAATESFPAAVRHLGSGRALRRVWAKTPVAFVDQIDDGAIRDLSSVSNLRRSAVVRRRQEAPCPPPVRILCTLVH